MKLWVYDAEKTSRLVDSAVVDIPDWGDQDFKAWLAEGGFSATADASVGAEDLSRLSGLSVEVYVRSLDRNEAVHQYLLAVNVGHGGEFVFCPTLWDYLAFMQAQAPFLAIALKQSWRALDEDSDPKTRND